MGISIHATDGVGRPIAAAPCRPASPLCSDVTSHKLMVAWRRHPCAVERHAPLAQSSTIAVGSDPGLWLFRPEPFHACVHETFWDNSRDLETPSPEITRATNLHFIKTIMNCSSEQRTRSREFLTSAAGTSSRLYQQIRLLIGKRRRKSLAMIGPHFVPLVRLCSCTKLNRTKPCDIFVQ